MNMDSYKFMVIFFPVDKTLDYIATDDCFDWNSETFLNAQTNAKKLFVNVSYNCITENVCIIQLIKDKQVAIKILNYCLKKREKSISIEKLLEKLPRVHPGSRLSLTPFKRMYTDTADSFDLSSVPAKLSRFSSKSASSSIEMTLQVI